MRVDQVIAYHARQRPDALAVIADDESLSYGQLAQRVDAIADGLAAHGIGMGDRVAILGPNCIDHPALMLAAASIGAVTTAINARLADPELEYVINDSCARLLLVCDPELVAAVSRLQLQHEPLRLAAMASPPPDWQCWDSWLVDHSQHCADENRKLVAHEQQADSPFVQLYTSGTTGRPKGAVISHRNLVDLACAGMVAAERRLAIGDRELVVAPLFHIGAVASLFYTLMMGVSVVLHGGFNPHAVVDAIERHRLSSLFVVPAMLQAILRNVEDLERRDFSTLKRINYGASPIGEQLLRESIAAFNCDFQQSYGMTESGGAIAQLTVADHRRALQDRPDLLASCGRPNAASRMRVIDEQGHEVQDGEAGEIVVQSSTVMLGYWQLPEETADVLRDGWLHTGDIGYRDADGYFFLLDRKKDVVISGGENIYPIEVERALAQHSDIVEAAVIGVPDETYGEALLAVCVCGDREPPDSEQLIAHCREHLAGYKVPRRFTFVDALPRNPSGKVLKTTLREPYWPQNKRRIS